MNDMVKRPWKAVFLLLAVFLAGALVGGVVCRMRPPMSGGRDPNGMIQHLTEELGLTQVQQDSIKSVLDRSDYKTSGVPWAGYRQTFTEGMSFATITPERRYFRVQESIIEARLLVR